MRHIIRFGTAFLLAGFIVLLLAGCSSRRITTAWKANTVFPTRYRQVLVVAILPDKDSLLRKKAESELVAGLRELGYQAVSSLDRFGANGLAGLGEQQTYLTLCDAGIDVVLTLAPVPESSLSKSGPYRHPHSYYYDRIWNYKSLATGPATGQEPYYWESILFDLSILEAALTLRTEPFAADKLNKPAVWPTSRIIRVMVKEKVLAKQPPKPAAPRPF